MPSSAVVTRSARFDRWFAALETRHGGDFTTREIGRAVRALSASYVEHRGRLMAGGPLASAGKRTAFALFYAPLHWLTIHEIVRALASPHRPPHIVDLGCGTGAAGAAWADTFEHPPALLGFDRGAWAVSETLWTYRAAGLPGSARRADVARARLPRAGNAVIAAYVLNELTSPARRVLVDRLVSSGRAGLQVLVVEPIARQLTPWWNECRRQVEGAGGRGDEWRFRPDLPQRLASLARSAGLDPHELTAKTLFLPGER
jgi:hypothetical protein